MMRDATADMEGDVHLLQGIGFGQGLCQIEPLSGYVDCEDAGLGSHSPHKCKRHEANPAASDDENATLVSSADQSLHLYVHRNSQRDIRAKQKVKEMST